MRTPKQKYEDMIRRGRTREQIRAVAIAREDRELLEYMKTVKVDPFA